LKSLRNYFVTRGQESEDIRNFKLREAFAYTPFSELQTAEETQEWSQVSGKKKSLSTQLDGFVQNVTPYGFNHTVLRKITQYVAEMIALDNQPFSIVEDSGFKQLFKVLEPRYKLPCR